MRAPFICRDGYGLQADTIGAMIYGEWADGSGTDRIPGCWIDAEATERRVAAQIGKEVRQ